MADTTRPPSHDATWDPTWGPEPTAAELAQMDTLTSADWADAARWWLKHWPEAEKYGVTRRDAIAFIRTAMTKADECRQAEGLA